MELLGGPHFATWGLTCGFFAWPIGGDHDARPLVKVYSRREVRKLFSLFKDVRVDIEQLPRPELRFLSPVVSESMLGRLRKRIGWNVIVTASK